MIKKTKIFIIIAISIFGINTAISQTFDSFNNINFKEISSNQLDLILRNAQAQGLNQFDLLQIAKSQGLSNSEIEILNKKITTAKNKSYVAENASTPLEDTRMRKQWEEKMEVFREMKSDVYGYEIFRGNTFLSFQSNLNIPTPSDYVLGPGDKLFIDIYGQSENYYQAEVSPDGDLILENFGPINVSGLTVEDSKKRLISRLNKVYTGINENKTFVNISVGIPRAVRVNIVGEVNLPGTYNFSAFNTVYNAIYVAGGITENATLREIKLFRNNKLVDVVDIYKFLNEGDQSSNLRLENNDLIVVGPYTNRVSISDGVKSPGKFEIKNGETVSDLIKYAGGFSENSYSKSIRITRIFDEKYKIVDVYSNQFDIFELKSGDKIEVDKIIEKYENRLIVKGSVYKPGVYSLSKNMSVKDLIEKAEGLQPDTFMNRGFITRTNEDFSTTNISFNILNQINELENPIFLEKDDILNIISINDLKDDNYIEISGEINRPGVYPFSKNLNLEDIILLAGGVRKNATLNSIEISRVNSSENSLSSSEVFYVDIDNLNSDSNFELKPFDNIIIRKDPSIEYLKFARIEGEVNYPGKYAISSKKERISDLLKRAGGPNEYAYYEGATIIRKTEFAEELSQIQNEINDLTRLREKLSFDESVLTESEKLLISRIDNDLEKLKLENNSNQDFSSFVKKERINEIVKRNAMSENIPLAKSESIGINLDQIIKSPGLKSDLLLEDGDIIIIPKKLETVRLRGELLYPTTVRHSPSRGLKYYINSAGGFDLKAKRGSTYVVYANGDVARTKKFLFFNLYPKAEPGCEVIVPKKSVKNPLAASQILNFTTGLAALILAINQIN
jgi:protein involved in polysaccharide export with SLBB domain